MTTTPMKKKRVLESIDHLGDLKAGETQLRLMDGELGTFRLMSTQRGVDGSLTVFGGDVDPSGSRMWRAFQPSRLAIENRKAILSKLHRQGHE